MGSENEVSSEILDRLTKGKSLDGLGIGCKNGRLLVANLYKPTPYPVGVERINIADITALGGITDLRATKWRSMEFSSSVLPGLRFTGCEVRDCIFEKCEFHDLRVWSTDFLDVVFCSTDLRGAVLGGVQGGRRNVFKGVQFISSNLSRTIYTSAQFSNCRFENSKLEKIDFQSCSFEDCSFVGELREVIFYDKGFKGGEFPRNAMKNVDFSQTKLRRVEFRGLDLESVIFPDDDGHVLIKDRFPAVLECLITFFESKLDEGSKGLAGMLRNKRKWLGSKQRVGIFSKTDILETAGDEGLSCFIDVVKRFA